MRDLGYLGLSCVARHWGPILQLSDFGSFPSGHVANAATIAVALLVLFPRVWVAVAGAAWVIVMAPSRAERLAVADDVIENDDGRDSLDARVAKLHQHYLALAAGKGDGNVLQASC